MAIKRFLFCFLSCLHVCQSYFDLFNDNLFESDKINNFIKDQFQENCFGVKSVSLMNSHVRTAKIQCASNPSKPTATTSMTPTPTSTLTLASISTSTPTSILPRHHHHGALNIHFKVFSNGGVQFTKETAKNYTFCGLHFQNFNFFSLHT